jgi:hypothetical protein
VLTAKAVPYSSRPEHKQVDKMFWATIALENDVIGEIHSNLDEPKFFGIIPRIPKLSATVECAGGKVEIFNFLIPHFYHYITVSPSGKPRRVEKAYSFKGAAKGADWWTTYRFDILNIDTRRIYLTCYRYQLEAFVDQVQGRTPQTWVDSDDTVSNMKWVEAIYAKVVLSFTSSLAVFSHVAPQDGFGSRPASKYVYDDDAK